jgi:2-hydroxy-3-keto-5-methylthiopentenyl-1-phosphate phosphatase
MRITVTNFQKYMEDMSKATTASEQFECKLFNHLPFSYHPVLRTALKNVKVDNTWENSSEIVKLRSLSSELERLSCVYPNSTEIVECLNIVSNNITHAEL